MRKIARWVSTDKIVVLGILAFSSIWVSLHGYWLKSSSTVIQEVDSTKDLRINGVGLGFTQAEVDKATGTTQRCISADCKPGSPTFTIIRDRVSAIEGNVLTFKNSPVISVGEKKSLIQLGRAPDKVDSDSFTWELPDGTIRIRFNNDGGVTRIFLN